MSNAPAVPPTTPPAAAARSGESGGVPHVVAPKTSVKETVTSVIIAFVMAFIFRGFVVEAFVIPTGSMAPTLMGAHMRFRDPANGYQWAVNPWYYFDRNFDLPKPVQGLPPDRPVSVTNPLTKERIEQSSVEKLAGDRIFVLKYLYSIFDPRRWDVVVFKNPREPGVNYIKRLIGLPNEQIALIDGDVFTRPLPADANASTTDRTTWSQPGWTIQRKPELVQRAVWLPVYNSEFAPRGDAFREPWIPKGGNGTWQIAPRKPILFTGQSGTIEWDIARWPITDRYAYNETPAYQPLRTDNTMTGGLPTSEAQAVFPVSDVRVELAITPKAAPVRTTCILTARRHRFRATLDPAQGKVVVDIQPENSDAWTPVGQSPLSASALAAGHATNLEFWFVDQSVQVYVENNRIIDAPYTWSPAERVQAAFGAPIPDLLAREGGESIFATPQVYSRPQIALQFEGGDLTIHRLRVDRDLFYQPTQQTGRAPAAGSHPNLPKYLGPDHFFCAGDNSPASDDCRFWNSVDPWVAARLDPAIGVVTRDLLIGKAFFVYFPSPRNRMGLPVPDFGRMRFIF